MKKLFVYNFNGEIYETYEPFDETFRKMKAEAEANGETFSRQVIAGDKIINQWYHSTARIWLDE